MNLNQKWLRDIGDQTTPATVVDGSEFYTQATRGQSREPQPPSPVDTRVADKTYDHTGIADLMPTGCQEEETITPWLPQRHPWTLWTPQEMSPLTSIPEGINIKQTRHERTTMDQAPLKQSKIKARNIHGTKQKHKRRKILPLVVPAYSMRSCRSHYVVQRFLRRALKTTMARPSARATKLSNRKYGRHEETSMGSSKRASTTLRI